MIISYLNRNKKMRYHAQDFTKHLNIIQNEKEIEDIFKFNKL